MFEYIFILVFACTTNSDITHRWNEEMYNLGCISEIKVIDNEKKLLEYMNSTVSTGVPKAPSTIYRYDKTGLKEINLTPTYDTKYEVKEKRILKGYKLK